MIVEKKLGVVFCGRIRQRRRRNGRYQQEQNNCQATWKVADNEL
jgi:hypothetical protein